MSITFDFRIIMSTYFADIDEIYILEDHEYPEQAKDIIPISMYFPMETPVDKVTETLERSVVRTLNQYMEEHE